jgi:hypothetical protein
VKPLLKGEFVFKFFEKTETTTRDLIDAANSHLFTLEPLEPEYDETLDKIERLHKLRSHEKDGFKVSPDTLVLVFGNLIGILLIMNYEKLDVISTKAFSFIRPKV